MKYKLLVLDVDGTLLNNAKEISKRTLAALLKVQHMGVRIVLASGRPTSACCRLQNSRGMATSAATYCLTTAAR